MLQALEKYNIEKDIAAYIKKEFDKKYGPTWHCIVGRNFGAAARREGRSEGGSLEEGKHRLLVPPHAALATLP